MQYFIDTANIKEIEEAFSWGIIDGVTTNPSLIKRAMTELGGNVNFENYLPELLSVVGRRPISLEVVALNEEGMVEEAKRLFYDFKGRDNGLNIKIPINTSESVGEPNYDALRATKRLVEEHEIPINCTLIMTPLQALTAAKAGATYISPFAGRIDDLLKAKYNSGHPEIKLKKEDYYPAEGIKGIDDNGIVSGVDLVRKCIEITQGYGVQIIAASLRSPRQVEEVALADAHIATIPFNVLNQMLSHEKTAEGITAFKRDTVVEYADFLRRR